MNMLFSSEVVELRDAAKLFPGYRPKVRTEDDLGECGPRCTPGGDDYAELHRLAEKIIPKLDSVGIKVPEGNHANPAGRIVYWAIPNKRALTLEHRPAANVFFVIADALEKVPDTKTDTKKNKGKKRQASAAARVCGLFVQQGMADDPTATRIQLVKDWVESKQGVWDGEPLSATGIDKMLQDNPETWKPNGHVADTSGKKKTQHC